MGRRRTAVEPDIAAVVGFVLEQSGQQQLAAYLREGRRFERLDADQLEAVFAASYATLTKKLDDAAGYLANRDAHAEYSLRQVRPPYEKHAALLEAYLAASVDHMKAMSADEVDEFNRGFLADYATGRAARH